MKKLTETFLIELLGSTLKSEEMMRHCTEHLKYEFFKDDAFKEIWKIIKKEYKDNQKLSTLGIISQKLDSPIYSKKRKEEIEKVIADIRNTSIPTHQELLPEFESFLKDSMAVEFYDEYASLYNRGKKDEANQLLKDAGERLHNFSIAVNGDIFEDVLGDYESRIIDRILKKKDAPTEKAVFGITPIDEVTYGGAIRGDTVLFLGRSGVGKTKLLKHIGIANIRNGLFVLHVQAEGTREECLDLYDASIAGVPVWKVERGMLEEDRIKSINGFSSHTIGKGGRLLVYPVEELGGFTMYEVENLIINCYRIYGRLPDVLILDYFELFDPGDKSYSAGEERHRRDKLGVMLKNIAIKYNLIAVTATQASSVPKEKLDDPEFCLTRFNSSEYKNVVKPFSFFITINQTAEEYNTNSARLHMDKVRKYRGGQIFRIIQSFDTERFFNAKASEESFQGDWEFQYFRHIEGYEA